MDKTKNKCLCGTAGYIVLSCSGASDVGEIADQVARKLSTQSIRKMSCLAVAGAGIEKSIASFKKKNILIIDGCPIDCGKRIMHKSGIDEYAHLRITDLGYQKGKTGVSSLVVDKIFEQAQFML